MAESPQLVEALVVVRTYPVPSRKRIEVSCTAAIARTGEWLRLFPVPYRFLEKEKRFRKYQWIEVLTHPASDPRPESRRIDEDSIRILPGELGTKNQWADRRRVVMPMKSESMCGLQRQRDEHKEPTLGFIRPSRIERLVIEPDAEEWSESELARLRQSPLWGEPPAEELEKIPFKFSYHYFCGSPDCSGHKQMCSDWEMSEAYRKFKERYDSRWEDMFRRKFELDLPQKHDLHFFVGTVNNHPSSWIIIGLWYPPLEQQGFLSLD